MEGLPGASSEGDKVNRILLFPIDRDGVKGGGRNDILTVDWGSAGAREKQKVQFFGFARKMQKSVVKGRYCQAP